jgi:hypothetical protein
MPHAREREPDDEGIRPQEKTQGPGQDPRGSLGGEPINADETAPRDTVPKPAGNSGGRDRHPEAVDDEPGSDL